MSLMSPVLAGGFFASSATWEAQLLLVVLSKSLLFENRKAHTLQLTKYLTRAKECITTGGATYSVCSKKDT